MDREKVKKASPWAITLAIALIPQIFTFCDNRAKAYEVERAAKQAKLVAAENGAEAEAGYKVLVPAVEELQVQRQKDREFMMGLSRRVDVLEGASSLGPSRPAPELRIFEDKRPAVAAKLPEDLAAAHVQSQKALLEDFRERRRTP